MLKKSIESLEVEDEVSLNYLYGYQVKNLSQLSSVVVQRKGFVFRFLSFIRFSVSSLSFSSNPSSSLSSFFFFAGTDNQMKSIAPICNVMELLEQDFRICIASKVNNTLIFVDKARCYVFRLDLNQFLVTMLLLIIRGLSLYKKLKNLGFQLAEKSFNKFAETYLYLPYFLDTLGKSRPSFVVMSNDHNTPNRCLRLSAHYLGIKTVYLQHASVSDLFPPLDFNISFLDGVASAKIYARCENNLKGKKQKERIIFLSGMSKSLKPSLRAFSKKIGMAINTLDQFEKLEDLARAFRQKNFDLHIRFHPAQDKDFISQLEKFVKTDPERISLSYPNSESLGDFFAQCSLLISGNSSIHLEAALVDVMTYYYEFSDRVEHPDYYGYVKNGISLKLPEISLMDTNEIKRLEFVPFEREQAVKFYAESFKTTWQGREGELIAKTLIELNEGEISSEIWQAADDIDGLVGVKVYRLKGL